MEASGVPRGAARSADVCNIKVSRPLPANRAAASEHLERLRRSKEKFEAGRAEGKPPTVYSAASAHAAAAAATKNRSD